MTDITKVTIRGVDVHFNWFDMENREEYEKANNKLQAKLEKLEAEYDKDPSDEINYFKGLCDAVHDLFSDLFGAEGTEKIFHGKHDYFACMDAIASLVSAKEKQAGVIESIANSPKLSETN